MKKRLFFTGVAAILAVLLGLSVAVLAQTPVTECGQVVPRGTVGILTGDLDCSHAGDCDNWEGGLPNCLAVRLEHRATLQLGGFSLVGPGPSVFRYAVDCDGDCRVIGPGTITGFTHGVNAYHRERQIGARAIVMDVSMSDIDVGGVRGGRCVHARWAKVRRSTLTGCGAVGISGKSVKVFDSVVSDGAEHGILGISVSLRNVEVTGNGGDGVHARTYLRHGGVLRARDSVVVGNGGNCPEGPGEPSVCVDVRGDRRIRLWNTAYDSCFPSWNCQ